MDFFDESPRKTVVDYNQRLIRNKMEAYNNEIEELSGQEAKFLKIYKSSMGHSPSMISAAKVMLDDTRAQLRDLRSRRSKYIGVHR